MSVHDQEVSQTKGRLGIELMVQAVLGGSDHALYVMNLQSGKRVRYETAR